MPARRLTLALLAVFPLIAWPGLPQPFSTPKLWTLLVAVVLLTPFAVVSRIARARSASVSGGRLAPLWLSLLWLTSWTWSALLGDFVSLDALLLAFSTALFAIILVELRSAASGLATAMVIGATGLAAVALAQAVGADPFALGGWPAPTAGGSARLRVYGTLGNPDFVAALLVATTPLTVSLLVRQTRGAIAARAVAPGPIAARAIAARAVAAEASEGASGVDGSAGRATRVALGAALAAQIAAAIATGSRAGALGLLVAAMTWAAFGGVRRRTRLLVAVLGSAIALLAIGVSTARPLAVTAAGRAYIWRVAWPHAWDAPWAGRGPGGFELLYSVWERDTRLTRHAPFAGPQQHAHNDYLEALIERGLPGPVTILLILTTCLLQTRRHPGDAHEARIAVGAVSMLAALAAIACVDFPLARPTELTWWWCAVAIVTRSTSGDSHGRASGLDVDARVGSNGTRDRPGYRHGQRDRPRGEDEVLGKA